MARPTTIHTQDLLRSVRSVFADCGASTTTAAIARHAGVSEGTLFKRFESKADLFRAAIEETFQELFALDPCFRPLTHSSLQELCQTYFLHLEAVVPIAMHMYLLQPTDTARGCKHAMPVQVRKHLQAFFLSEIDARRLPACDAEVLASTVQGTLWHFAFMKTAFGLSVSKTQIDHFASLIWNGIGASPAARSSRPLPRKTQCLVPSPVRRSP